MKNEYFFVILRKKITSEMGISFEILNKFGFNFKILNKRIYFKKKFDATQKPFYVFEVLLNPFSLFFIYSPVNEGSKMANRKKKKKNRLVLKFGRIVEGNVLNNILKAPAGRR